MERRAWRNQAGSSRYQIPYNDDASDSFDEDLPFRHAQPQTGYRHWAPDMDAYMDDIADSSPSPPERRNPGFHQYNVHHHRPAAPVRPMPRSVQPQFFLDHNFRPPSRYMPIQMGQQQSHFLPQSLAVPQENRTAFEEVSSRFDGNGGAPRDTYPRKPDLYTERPLRLRPVSELPDMYRGIFKFGVFNAVQSTCFDTILQSNENTVISAPTGSGKTVLFELAIIRMLAASSNTSKLAKCIYVAPTKALCTEKYKEWTIKFGGLGIKCSELTGDTVHFGKSAWGDAKDAQIIVTTGEKWDSLTRNWDEQSHILSHIQLFLVDEVHILNESRGSTLEVIVSRMKTRGSAVRFVLVSATVPNIEDVASWVGNMKADGSPAKIYQFGEEFRPCKLSRFVYGVPKPKNQNDFAFSYTLDARLYSVLQQHSSNKPALIFVPTRKGTLVTAKLLAKAYEDAAKSKQPLPWPSPAFIDSNFHDKDIQALAAMGIGVHHAGLNMDDRRLVEDMFLKKIIQVVVATSTLAVGVNLPAYMVVIKGVKIYQNNGVKEYSDLDVMQMMGRAGRPQFDTEGVAVILCEVELESKYRALAQGTTMLESSLHLNLSEHLNSEIGLGTITDVKSAKEWLCRSFFYRRIQKNPKFYSIGKDEGQSWQDKIDEIVAESVEKLQNTEMVTYTQNEGGKLVSTDYGDIMSKFYIRQQTMNLIMSLPPGASVRDILEMLSAADELADLKLRSGEKQVYDKLRSHDDMRFRIPKIQKTSDKMFLLIQAVLGGIPLNGNDFKNGDSQPHYEAFSIFRHITRIATAALEVAIVKKCGAQAKHGLEIVRCLHAKAWEDRPVLLRQIDHIGEKSVKVLAQHGISTFDSLLKQDPIRIDALLNRRPPFGFEVLASAREFPKYDVDVAQVSVTPSDGKAPVEVELSIKCGLEAALPSKAKKQKGQINMTTVLTMTSDLVFIDFRRILTKGLKQPKTFLVNASLTKPSQSVIIYVSSDKICGVTVTKTYKPTLLAHQYPTLDTRPLTSLEMDLIGLENYPDFWKVELDSEDEKSAPVNVPKPPEENLTQKRQSNSNSTVTDSTVPSTQKRPDGKYECNHPCKKKMSCRHYCCREGLADPPQVPKKKVQSTFDEKTGNTTTRRTNGVVKTEGASKSKEKKASNRTDCASTTQKGTGTERDLKLAEGQRSKLGSRSTVEGPKQKSRVVPNFDLEFATLRCSESPSSKHRFDGSDDEDDLPDIIDLIWGTSEMTPPARSLSSETSYSNSEVDALIRNLPSDVADPKPTTAVERSAFENPSLKRRRSIPPSDSPPYKRSRSQVNPEYYFGSPSALLDDKRMTPPTFLFKANNSEPLFLPSQDSTVEDLRGPDKLDDGEGCESVEYEFHLDEDCFDIVPAGPYLTAKFPTNDDTPPNTYPTEYVGIKSYTKLATSGVSGNVNDLMPTGSVSPPPPIIPTTHPFLQQVHTLPEVDKQQDMITKAPHAGESGNTNTTIRKERNDIMEDDNADNVQEDPLAEFEQWLMSGAVDIIPS